MKYNKKLLNRIGLIGIITVLMWVVNAGKSKSLDEVYVNDNKGELTSINLPNDDLSHKYDVVALNEEGEMVEVSININGSKDNKDIEKNDIEENEFKSEVYEIVSLLENTSSEKIVLPNELENGVSIHWYKKNNKDYSGLIYISIGMAIIGLIIKNHKEESIKEKAKLRKEILMELPRFTNQLILLLNSGLIMNDCFKKIVSNYRDEDLSNKSKFKRELINIADLAEMNNQNIIIEFNNYANKIKIKELSRIAMVTIENLERGIDIRERIEIESQYLWSVRKSIARENGKFIETKMTLPLSLLLIILVIVTMAPAIMNI